MPDFVLRFHHIGLVVHDLAAARKRLAATLGLGYWTEVISDPIQKVDVQFGTDVGGLQYELITPIRMALLWAGS